MHDFLTHILDHKRREVEALYASSARNDFSTQVISAKSFKAALQQSGLSIIAEIKRRSPSKNHLADIADPLLLAEQYVKGGARAISVLTDQPGFNGSLDDLRQLNQAKALYDTPLLRKDFILDEVQIAESIDAGANAILLIVAILQDKTDTLLKKARAAGLDVLVEVHTEAELQYALSIGADIIGVNNRNLTTFEVDTQNALTLKKHIPDTVITVAESGIHDAALGRAYAQAGFDAVLVGEALVKAESPEHMIQQLMGET